MDMQASRELAVTQQQAWDALNDPAVLKTCIPGCDKVEAVGENQYAIGMALKIGPVSAKFSGKIALSDINPPASYKLSFDGQGGPAGFGKGSAEVRLLPNEDGCELSYTVHASVGGKVAQLGQRLIDGAAKSMAEDFFKRFDEEMQRQHPESYAAKMVKGEVETEPEAGARSQGVPMWVWIAGAAALALVVWLAS
ncbi:SRPBCC family protein [Polaromonas jejuensis]|uniref:Carbon monoxide dehydrogenase subunit G n=1 Tax=Polaromonas jejuensis TaxID=457502 RepID=A0ABW0QAC5_9BURK|nr:carbon monoxide dehydrogenase subunit G [Polaromonas jejuensis]